MFRDPARRNVLILALAQGLMMAGTSTLIAEAALVGHMLAENKALATLRPGGGTRHHCGKPMGAMAARRRTQGAARWSYAWAVTLSYGPGLPGPPERKSKGARSAAMAESGRPAAAGPFAKLRRANPARTNASQPPAPSTTRGERSCAGSGSR